MLISKSKDSKNEPANTIPHARGHVKREGETLEISVLLQKSNQTLIDIHI